MGMKLVAPMESVSWGLRLRSWYRDLLGVTALHARVEELERWRYLAQKRENKSSRRKKWLNSLDEQPMAEQDKKDWEAGL